MNTRSHKKEKMQAKHKLLLLHQDHTLRFAEVAAVFPEETDILAKAPGDMI